MANGNFAGGSGVAGDPYLIEDAFDLDAVRNNLTAHYKLIADIDLDVSPFNEGGGWAPIGDNSTNLIRFKGIFDGDGYKISNLYINRPSVGYIGLFGYTLDSKLSNILLENVNIIGGVTAGTLSGMINRSIVTNCHSTGSVSGSQSIGGLVGDCVESVIRDSHSECDIYGLVSSQHNIGGLVGYFRISSSILNSYATGNVDGGINTSRAGGLVGSSNGADTIEESYATGNVFGMTYVGGFIGYNTSTIIKNSYSHGDAQGDGSSIGGFVGNNHSTATIESCYSTGRAIDTNGSSIGGFSGAGDGPIINSFWDVESSGVTTSTGGAGLTTEQMQNPQTFIDAGWDQELNDDGEKVWSFAKGHYPQLWFDPIILNKTLILLGNGEYRYLAKGKKGKNEIPVMTSNTSPSGTASASETAPAGTHTYDPWKAFDGDMSYSGNGWLANTVMAWLQYDFGVGNSKVINKYRIMPQINESNLAVLDRCPKSWTFEGSNDGENWTVLDSQTGVTQSDYQLVTFTDFLFENNTAYQMYRINITENNGDSQFLAIGEMEMWSPDQDGLWRAISINPTKEDFEEYGISNLSEIPESAWKELSQISPTIQLVQYVPTDNAPSNFNVSYDAIVRDIEMNALPIEQFVVNPTDLQYFGDLQQIIVSELGEPLPKGILRFVVTFDEGQTWWSYRCGKWNQIDLSSLENIKNYGMSLSEVNGVSTDAILEKENGTINIGYYIEERAHRDESAKIDEVKVVSKVPMNDMKFSDLAFYLLNTTATINLTFAGNKIEGVLDDEDKGKVKYRVILNGEPYFPANGDFTPLIPSPTDINIVIDDRRINFGVENTLIVEFQDYWGQVDSWITNFIGTHSGLLFSDEQGNLYSTAFGEVLKYLDFGQIIAGQTTLDQKVMLVNNIGYDVKNVSINAIQPEVDGVTVELSKQQSPFVPESVLTYPDVIKIGDEVPFYVRINTVVTAKETPSGTFEIRVKADRAD